MTLLSVNRNATSSYDHTHAVSSMYKPPLRTSRKRISLTASIMASLTQASIETLGGTDQKLLQDFMTSCTIGPSKRRRCMNGSRGATTTTRGAQMTSVPTRASGTTRVHPESTSHMTSSWLWIVLREAGRQQRRSNSKSSCRRNAHGIQVPIMRQSIATTSGGHSAIPAMTRGTSQRMKSPKRMTKGTNRIT
jgi:hypothetical protein